MFQTHYKLERYSIGLTLGIILVAIKKPGGRMVFNPEPATILEANDLLIALGHRQQLDRLDQLARA